MHDCLYLDKMINDLESAVRDVHPLARSFSVYFNMSRYRPEDGIRLDAVSVGFFLDREQFSFSMFDKKDYVAALQEHLTPTYDPIEMGA